MFVSSREGMTSCREPPQQECNGQYHEVSAAADVYVDVASADKGRDGEVVSAATLSFEERLAAPADHIPRRGGKLLNKEDWTPMPKEGVWAYLLRICVEGHTVPDAFMTCACAQVGQIMLNSPGALFLMGLYSGAISMVFFLGSGYWTLYQFMALYLEYKRCKIKDGSWYESEGKHIKVVQAFEIFGFFLGKWAYISSVILAFVALIGVLMTQINACANNMFFVDSSRTKQEWSLIYGGAMVFTMSCIPRFTHFRFLNVIGLVTVGYTAIYIIIVACQGGLNAWAIKGWPKNSQEWFNGASIWLAILGTHAVTMETLESMEQPKYFKEAFVGAWLWTILVTIPHSIISVIAYGPMFQAAGAATSANIFIFLERTTLREVEANKPPSMAKYAAAIMMNMHQFIAFALYGTSLAYIWEKAWGVHTKPWYIRIPCRLPLAGFIWFLAILAPFYGPINALYASLAIPYLGFFLPSVAMLYFFRSREQLENSLLKPYRWIRWAPVGLARRLESIHPYLGLMSTPWFWFNAIIGLIYLGFGAASIYYSTLYLIQAYQTFGPFASCYGCPPPRPSAVPRPTPSPNVTG